MSEYCKNCKDLQDKLDEANAPLSGKSQTTGSVRISAMVACVATLQMLDESRKIKDVVIDGKCWSIREMLDLANDEIGNIPNVPRDLRLRGKEKHEST